MYVFIDICINILTVIKENLNLKVFVWKRGRLRKNQAGRFISQLHQWPQDFGIEHIMHLITVPLSAQIHKETKSDRLYTKRQHVGNYSVKTADTELYIYQTLPDTLSDCAPWFSCCIFPAASERPSLALLLHPPGPLNVGISRLGSGYFSFLSLHSLLTCTGLRLVSFRSQLCEPFFAPRSLPDGQRFPLGSQPTRRVLWNRLWSASLQLCTVNVWRVHWQFLPICLSSLCSPTA